MKTLTCKDMGGPCDTELAGSSFAEIGKKSHDHVLDQIGRGDEAHRAAAARMRDASPDEQKSMMATYEKRYNEAPNS